MRLLTFLFALMLVMGLSFGGASLITSQPVIAEEGETAEGETAEGEMADDAAGDDEGAEAATEETAEGEIPGGEMADDAEK